MLDRPARHGCRVAASSRAERTGSTEHEPATREEHDMRVEAEHERSPASEPGAGPAPRRARVLERADLPHSETSYEFAGYDHGEIGASAIVIDAPPGSGPRLHRHPYTEVFIVL